MPIYEYRCTACERVSEEWVRSFDSPEEKNCPYCGEPAKRIMSNTSFQLKGGGWYVTDYGSHKNVPKETGEATSTETATDAAKVPAASAETSTTPATTAEASATPATPPATPPTTPSAAPSTPSSAASAA